MCYTALPTCSHGHLMGPKWAAFWVPNGLPHMGPIWICPGASIGSQMGSPLGQPTWDPEWPQMCVT